MVLSRFARGAGYASTNYYDHSSLLRTFQEIFGVQPLLGGAATATNLSELFLPFGLSSIERIPSGAMRLTLSGVTPGRTNVLEGSPDLVTWVPVFTNVATGTVMNVTDHAATNLTRRFYRFVEYR
jgi:hypothetical protein